MIIINSIYPNCRKFIFGTSQIVESRTRCFFPLFNFCGLFAEMDMLKTKAYFGGFISAVLGVVVADIFLEVIAA